MNTNQHVRHTSTDASGHSYVQLLTQGGEAIRLTWILETPGKPSWAGEPRLRVNKVKENGHTVPGPEIPESQVPEFVAAIVQLITGLHNGSWPEFLALAPRFMRMIRCRAPFSAQHLTRVRQ